MNNSALNGRVLGAGNRSVLSLASAHQVLRLVGAASARVLRRVSIAQTLQLTQAITAGVTTFATASQSLYLSTAFTVSQWIRVYGSAIQRIQLTFQGVGVRTAMGVSSIVLRLTSRTTPLHVRVFEMAQTFALTTSLDTRKAVRAVIAQTLHMMRSIGGQKAQRGAKTQALSMLQSISVRIARVVPMSMAQALRMLTQATGFDITSSKANAERTATVPYVERVSMVPGDSYEAGV